MGEKERARAVLPKPCLMMHGTVLSPSSPCLCGPKRVLEVLGSRAQAALH